MKRRTYLVTTGAVGAAMLAGCTDDDTPNETGDESDETDTQSSDEGGGDDEREGGGGNTNDENGTDGPGVSDETGSVADETDEPDEGEDDEHEDDETSDENDESEPDESGDENDEAESASADGYFTTAGWSDPTAIQYNPFNPAGFDGPSVEILYDDFAGYNVATREWTPHGLTAWEIDEETGQVRLELRDDLVWSDGYEITAADLEVQLHLAKWLDDELWTYITDVDTVDDRSIVLDLAEPVGASFFEFVLLDRKITAPAHEFGDYLERLVDGEDPDTVLTELAALEWDRPIASGPFELEERTARYNRYRVRDDHPDAERVEVNGFTVEQRTSNEAFLQSLHGADLDGATVSFASAAVVDRFPDSLEEIRFPAAFGPGLVFNHDDQHVGRRAVRQAIAFAIDPERAAANAGSRMKTVPTVPAGLSTNTLEHSLEQRVLDRFESYDRNDERARERLRSAGYEYDTSAKYWFDRDGTPLRLELTYPRGWSDWVAAFETVARQLERLGIDVELTGVARRSLEMDLLNGDFQVAGFEWNRGAVEGYHPYYSLAHQLRNRQLDVDSSFFAYPERVTVPAMGGEGDRTVDIERRLTDLTAADEDDAREALTELAWVVNRDLPMLPIVEDSEQWFLSNDGWEYPGPEDDAWTDTHRQWPSVWLAKRGTLRPTDPRD